MPAKKAELGKASSGSPPAFQKVFLALALENHTELVQHSSLASAETEAERLAAQNPGKVFRVFACRSAFQAEIKPAKFVL